MEDEKSREPSEARVREAFRAWGRSVLGAPRRLDDQITAIEVRDDIIVRVATEVVRRDLVERRVAAHEKARRSADSAGATTVDPFAGSQNDLRGQTEHTEACASCGASGLIGCPGCGASGRARCGECGGSGRTYAKSSRGAKCRACRETGYVRCARCDGTANVTCDGCAGSGQQLVWLDFDQSVRVVVAFLRDSPILLAHRYLGEPRMLSPRDLNHFAPLVTVQHEGSIQREALKREDAESFAQIAPKIDRRLERVTSQQFAKFGVVRRDVRYEMSGTTGVVALSGATLLGANTPDALRPVHLRLFALGATGIVSILAAAWLYSAFSRPTAYFATVNSWISRLLVVGVVAAIVAASDTMRRLRPGLRWWPSARGEQVAASVLILAFGSVPVVALVGRPSVPEARAAIVSGNLERASVVVETLKLTRTSSDVADVEDELQIAQADGLDGDARIAKLDEVAARGGPRAGDARSRAAQARLEAVRKALAGRQPATAVSMLDRWSAELASTPGVPEARAEAFDQTAAACTDPACAFLAAHAADAASTSPPRVQAVSTARQQLLAALEPKEAADPDPLRRVRALRTAATLAKTAGTSVADPEVAARSSAAIATLEAALSKVSLVGSPVALVNEVLDRPMVGSPLTGWQGLDGVAVYPTATDGRCAGIYVVGATAATRSLSGKEPGLNRLLAQATGKATATIQSPPKSTKEHDVTRWIEGQTPIMARWRGGTLMELRIGAAAP